MSRKGSNRSENLIGRTRKLINGYPKNSILKEFLQNADDAKATELIVTYDARIHTSLDNTDFSPAKGPALLICNDSKFEEKDFNAIIEIGAEGSKQDDPNSTGRFGEGFNSSFSISDHPSFISNGRAYWFDILREAVSKDAGSPDTPYWEEDDFDEIKDWLDVFTVGSEAYFNSYDTVFRLPLRNSKTESRISNEVFSRKDFLEWVDEWKTNASQLLFLRHIQRLVLQEISTNEHTTIHLDISTKNKSEILTINNSIQEKFIGSPLEICMDWKDTTEELPFFKYKHHFSIDYFDREKQCNESYKENWAVVNGLFRGENNNLINQAIKALEIRPEPRKVMPWAGVAIKLDNKGKPQKTENSQYFTFLPLPITSHNPVHIHGWFEINSERTQITCVESGEDLEILTEWNKLLFEQGVGVAWAYLIDYIKELCLANSYYTFWPKNNDDQFDTYLLTGFYNKISGLQCFKTSYKDSIQWSTPKDNIYYLQSGLDKNLFSAFREHYSLITPKPNINVIEGLTDVDVELQEIKPKFIREFLLEESKEHDFPVSLNDVPIKMLSQKKWLLAILIFCAEAEKNADYRYLDELPLQIASDNKLYLLGDHCLIDEEPNFAIFDGNKTLFLDADIVEIVKDAENLPSSWYQPTLKNYLRVLHDYIDQYDLKDKKWLKNLITLITKSDQLQIDEAVEELHQLQVVYQHDKTFGFLESKVDSPVLVPKEEVNNIPLLAKTGISLVHSDYIDIYSPLIKVKDVDLITELSPFSLIEYLVQISEEEYSFFEDRELREYLVDFIAQDTSWFDELSFNDFKLLDGMPFIITESGNLYSRSDDKKLFLPAGFKPPENIQSLQGEYELITVVDDKQRALFQKMEFEEQNPANYLEEIIIPFIGGSPSVDDVKKILEWLANEWEQLIGKITKEEKNDLLSKLSGTKIILDSENIVKTAKAYYHPNFLSELPGFLHNKKYTPLTFESDETQQNWQKLLSLLGASQKIIPQHIVDMVESISEEQDYKRSIELLNYILNHFEWFDDMQYQNKPIFEYLSDLAWIPAEKPKEILRPSDEYKVLRKPSEIIQAKDYMIAGGCHYSLSSKVKFGKKDGNSEFSKREMAQKLKLLVNLPAESVFESLRRLSNVPTNNNKEEEKISNYAKAFYKYIGRALPDNEIPDDIKDKSIFIMGRWLPSNKVFQSPPAHLSGIFSWDDLVTNDDTESQLAKGLIKLGVLGRPDNNYLLGYLHSNIPKNEKLNGQQLKEAKAILNHFQGNLEDLEVDDIPLISGSGQLIDCSDLYIKDLPAYNNSEKKNDQIEFCQQQFEKLAKCCDVVSLADSVTPQLDDEHSQEYEIVNNSWNDYIRSEPFKLAVLRLIYHEGKISDDEIEQDSIDKVLPSEVLLMDRLVVNYYIDGVWIYDDIETSTYQDTENSILYLLNQDSNYDMCESITTFIVDSLRLSNDSLFLINRILQEKYDNSEEIQGLLDKKNIKSLPEKIDIDEDISLYGDNTESSNDLDDSTSHNENIDQDDSSSEKDDQENEQPPSDCDQNSEDNSPESNEPEKSDDEIPPPTKPKQSSSQNDAIDTSSGDHNQNTGNSDHNWHGHNATRGSQSGGGSNWQGGSSSGTRPKSTRNSVSPNNRMPVYVGKEKELDKERTEEEREYAKKIGGKGEQYVLDHSKEYLFSTSNRFVKAATDNNKGYDITEVDSNGEIVRYIEVKTLTGQWGEGGVGITESQLEFAQVYDNWWLFVVENINTENTQIHVLENPLLQANRFMFDHSWKQLAVETKGAKDINPQAGEKYLLPEGEYELLSVDPKGKFFKVILKHTQSNKEVTKKFDPSWEKC